MLYTILEGSTGLQPLKFVKFNAVINYKHFADQQDLSRTDTVLVPTRLHPQSSILRREG
jgi:hypothetical protein